jgi:ferritin-like metal-binding protein YciE
MASTDTIDKLLIACVQDLYAGAILMAERLPKLVPSIEDAALASLLQEQITLSRAQADALQGTGRDTDGPANLWMKGILKDAKRDSKSIAPGPLLDIALIGAIRKGFAAEIVSYETAIAVAATLGDAPVRAAAERNMGERQQADHALRDRLAAITSSLAPTR